MRRSSEAPDPRSLRLVAPIGLVIGVVVLCTGAWWLAAGLRVQTVTLPVDLHETGPDIIADPGPTVFVVLETDGLSDEVIGLVETITDRSAAVPGVTRVESITDVGVLATTPAGEVISTPAFGSASQLDPSLDLEARRQRAAAGRLGTAGLLDARGTHLLIAAEIDAGLDQDRQAEVAESFRSGATAATADAGPSVDTMFGGEALTTVAATDDVRADLFLLVGLACVAPACIGLVVLRRRVPAGALLAAGGAALLLASILVGGEAVRGRSAPVEPDHPVMIANEVADRDLRGTVPVAIDIVGAPGSFRRPDVLARMDALTTWLRDEYGVSGVDLATTLRAETGAVTGVDSIPASPEDIATLLAVTSGFDDGRFLSPITNDDYSRTRIVAWLPDEGRSRLTELAGRLDRISDVVFADLGIAARFKADVVSPAPTRELLADDLALLGLLAVAVGAAVALATLSDRHRHEERHRAHHRHLRWGGSVAAPDAGRRGSSPGDPTDARAWGSLFTRHTQDHYPDPDDRDDRDDTSDTRARTSDRVRPPGTGTGTGTGTGSDHETRSGATTPKP